MKLSIYIYRYFSRLSKISTWSSTPEFRQDQRIRSYLFPPFHSLVSTLAYHQAFEQYSGRSMSIRNSVAKPSSILQGCNDGLDRWNHGKGSRWLTFLCRRILAHCVQTAVFPFDLCITASHHVNLPKHSHRGVPLRWWSHFAGDWSIHRARA